MRTENPTHPFAPPVTERHERWPLVNDLDDTALPEPPGRRRTAVLEAGLPDEPPVRTTPPRSPVSSPVHNGTRLEARAPARVHGALPPVGDFWDLQNAGRIVPAAPLPRPAAYLSRPAMRRTVTPAASLALTTGLISIPLTLALGLGAILGLVAVVSGAVAIRQVRSAPADRKGTGRAITGIVAGTGSMIVGGPILFLVLLLAGL
ncbi:DUF4190 domain-containing protein [Gordonia terrae]|uniref:DUF4190 domain-containing protein n=1 Tax=Gordonia terrae TaxID=2055 RepID=UPI003F6BF9E7